MSRTAVIGASPNPNRYAYLAVKSLRNHNIPVLAIGLRPGNIDDVQIETGMPKAQDIDTVSLYVGPRNQEFWKDYILSLTPKRIIFNPGTENPDFEEAFRAQGIEVIYACTLVLLSTGQYPNSTSV